MAYTDYRPYMLISPDVAELLLQSVGSSLTALDAARASLQPGELFLTEPGMWVDLSLQRAGRMTTSLKSMSMSSVSSLGRAT